MATTLTRRSFTGLAAGVVGLSALTGFVGCTPGDEDQTNEATTPAAAEDWRPFRCVTNNCAATCVTYALVEDGVVTRIKADDRHEDSWEHPLQKGCHRGMARRQIVYGADRLKYPMKRAHWEPGGGDTSLRGQDTWIRISWDEAIEIVASEMLRIKETYGNEAIFKADNSENMNIIAAFGGALGAQGNNSQGAWPVPVIRMTGILDVNVFFASHLMNDRIDLMNSKLIVLWGVNPSWSSIGFPNYVLSEAKRRGAKIISVDPFFNNTHSNLADQWVPVRPATDTALLLGIAYAMIDENLQDQEFLDAYTVGFDAEHMPEGAPADENFKDYVLGTYDGVSKTPEWASAICGIDPETIRGLARDFATSPAAFISGGAPARAKRGEQFCQAFLTVGWMTGNVGKPGSMVADSYHIMAANGGGLLVTNGATGAPYIQEELVDTSSLLFGDANPAEEYIGIPRNEEWTAILDGHYTDGPRGQKTCDIKMIYDICPHNTMNQWPGTMRAIEAYRKVEFVVSSDSFFTPAVQHADVILPTTMNWERHSQFGYLSNRETLIYSANMIDPLFEAKDDAWIENELAKKFGIDPATINIDPAQGFYNQLAGALVMKEDGSDYEPLLTITEEDINELGATGEPQTGRIEYQQFKQDGIYQVSRSEGDSLGYIAFAEFIEDPEANPLLTESGKFQIHSQALADQVAAHGSYTISPIAKYVAPEEGYETTFEDFETKVPGKYPLQMITPHYVGRMHSTFDNVPWLKEAHPHEMFINPLDAEERNIEQGDAVKMYNDRGAIVRQAKISRRTMPGVVLVGEGGWVDYDEELGVDLGGCANVLTDDALCGSGVQPWNTINLQVEKWEESITPDALKSPRVPVEEGA